MSLAVAFTMTVVYFSAGNRRFLNMSFAGQASFASISQYVYPIFDEGLPIKKVPCGDLCCPRQCGVGGTWETSVEAQLSAPRDRGRHGLREVYTMVVPQSPVAPSSSTSQPIGLRSSAWFRTNCSGDGQRKGCTYRFLYFRRLPRRRRAPTQVPDAARRAECGCVVRCMDA